MRREPYTSGKHLVGDPTTYVEHLVEDPPTSGVHLVEDPPTSGANLIGVPPTSGGSIDKVGSVILGLGTAAAQIMFLEKIKSLNGLCQAEEKKLKTLQEIASMEVKLQLLNHSKEAGSTTKSKAKPDIKKSQMKRSDRIASKVTDPGSVNNKRLTKHPAVKKVSSVQEWDGV